MTLASWRAASFQIARRPFRSTLDRPSNPGLRRSRFSGQNPLGRRVNGGDVNHRRRQVPHHR